ncbi:MAG: PDZ domain-containing protein [Alphaproteobacteria bacterium]|nr:PDZ domain-containing protein [Alphaproteobacteria bacterium]
MASIAAAAIAGSLVTGTVLTSGIARPAISADTFRQLDLFGEVFEQVHASYVESPNDAELIEGAINGMMGELDPHSSYLSADDYAKMQEQTRGSFAGLGIQVVMDNEGEDAGFVKVVAPIDGTPASRAGIQTNDLIVEIDGKDVKPLNLDEAIALLKGEKGTPVNIKVVRDRSKDPFPLKLVRDIVRVEAVTSRLEGDFGYVRVRTFSERAGGELKDAIRDLEKERPGGPKGYVLDLRSNPGGLLDQAVAVADVFLEGGEIVSTRGRHPRDTMREMGRRGDLTAGKPVIVMINGGSASASEIVAGALQDRNRALLLGTKSFGKGSVQTVIPLRNGLQGALRLTTARYYTPSGRSIQAQGIMPDVIMPVIYPGQDEISARPSERDLEGALDVPSDADDGLDPDDAGTPPTDIASSDDDNNGVAPVECGYEEDGETFKDCQLERAIEILSDATAFRALLADAGAGAAKTQ